MTTTDPLLDEILTLREELSSVLISQTAFAQVERELRDAESRLADRELAAYLAGEDPARPVAQSETPLSSAELLARMIEMRGTDPLPSVTPRAQRRYVTPEVVS